MRVNIYNEELTHEVEIVTVEPRPGVTYIGVRFMLKSAPELHHRVGDDDRSGVTFWLGTRTAAAKFFEDTLSAIRSTEEKGRAE